ncbi:MAG TPA: NAD(P)/FAD-dependent oxidoreductase [Tetragenococcus sp.]|nr:NAD(P)/FAD-dependent oxidoreductase [Tetragenococcus sp.]
MDKKNINKTYDYLLVGGGMVAGYAVKGIREIDKKGSIAMLSADTDTPYERPALSKKLWIDPEFTEDQITILPEDDPETTVELQTIVKEILPEEHLVELADGQYVGYQKLLLATGGKPNTIDGPESDQVIVFRDFSDYRKLRQQSGQNQEVIVIGGSYIGTEIAAALIQNNTKVTLVYPDKLLNEKRFPQVLAREYEDAFSQAGVKLVKEKRAKSYSLNSGKVEVALDDGTVLKGDTLVIGLGISPRIQLAQESGLKLANGGVWTDEKFHSSKEDIWVAGDIASYPDPILGRKRIEHVDHARKSGEVVGRIMAGANETYDHTPYFYSLVFSISWQAIGKTDASLETIIDEVGDGKIVYYIEDEKLVGVLVWNAAVDLDEVRALLKNPPDSVTKLSGSLQEKD